MKKNSLLLLAALSLAFASTSYSKTSNVHKSDLPFVCRQSPGIKLLTDTADTPEIASASISGDVLNISLLVPQWREPDSLEIRTTSGTWTGANLINAYTSVSWPYTDQYGRRCWIFQIPLTNFATHGDFYVLRFKDFYGTTSEEYIIYY